MSTHCLIGVANSNGTVETIYCHHDGYLSFVGNILATYYTTEHKVRELIDLGNISSLGYEIGEKHDFNTYSRKQCTAYMRDRRDSILYNRPMLYSDARQMSCCGDGFTYNYLFIMGEWLVNTVQTQDKWFRLCDVLAKEGY